MPLRMAPLILASTVISHLFGAQIGVWALVACVVSYLFSGHTGIYRAQRVGHAKHRHVPEGLKLGEQRGLLPPS